MVLNFLVRFAKHAHTLIENIGRTLKGTSNNVFRSIFIVVKPFVRIVDIVFGTQKYADEDGFAPLFTMGLFGWISFLVFQPVSIVFSMIPCEAEFLTTTINDTVEYVDGFISIIGALLKLTVYGSTYIISVCVGSLVDMTFYSNFQKNP